jgi:hypothetical protein
MADNTTLNTGVGGNNVASDDIAGVHYQRIKMVHGQDGVNDGDVSSVNPLPTAIKKFCILNESSSITPLVGNDTWTTQEFSTANCGTGILVLIFADQNGTVYLDEKVTGGTYRVTAYSPYTANTPFSEMHVSHGDTWRVRFVNGSSANTIFEIKISQIPWGIPWITKIDPNANTVSQGTPPWAFKGTESHDSAAPTSGEGIQSLVAVVNASSPTYTNGNLALLSVNTEGKLRTSVDSDGASTITRVTQSATSVMIVAANTSRGYMIIHNDSPANLYIKYGTTASATSYTYKIRPDAIFEMHPSYHYESQIDGIWDAAGSGAAQVTDMTHT